MGNYTRNGALISDCRRYRYRLWREWATGEGTALFIMLNPSTADGKQDDPTIRRCVSFAQSWGKQRLEVVNLFAYRAADPRMLTATVDPVGPNNFKHLLDAAEAADIIVCAWGNRGDILKQAERVTRLLRRYDLKALKVTSKGHPAHPLYIPSTQPLIGFGQ